MDKEKAKIRPERPRKVANIRFPPAKYGLYLAIGIIAVGVILMLFDRLPA